MAIQQINNNEGGLSVRNKLNQVIAEVNGIVVGGDVSAESSIRASVDSTLSTAISTEASTRTSADTSLASEISEEASIRASVDSTLSTAISTRVVVDSTLSTAISSANVVRASVDSTLSSAIVASGGETLDVASVVGEGNLFTISSGVLTGTTNLQTSLSTAISSANVVRASVDSVLSAAIGSAGGDVDLGVTTTGTHNTITNTGGDSAVLSGATTTAAGLVTTGAQTFRGMKTFDDGIRFSDMTISGITLSNITDDTNYIIIHKDRVTIGEQLIDLKATVISNSPIQGPNGSSSAPTFSFSGETSTGMYKSGTGVISFAIGSLNRLSISAESITSSKPFLGTVGTNSSPSFSFSADPDTGVYRPSTNILGFSAGGTKIMEISSTNVLLTYGLTLGTSSLTTNGTIRWDGTNFQGYKGSWVNLDESGGVTTLDIETLTGNTFTVSFSDSKLYKRTLSGNPTITVSTPSSSTVSSTLIIVLINSGSTNYTVTWTGIGIKWQDDTVLTTIYPGWRYIVNMTSSGNSLSDVLVSFIRVSN